ncbi:phosphonate metabolism protein/1,5-bisphosphokinase (PRPP-forming) PhnN [Xinfangfangia sp. CPCC 101601]|uniref:Ribose 1,5-bisphosphate phosphokinase PhnN n=1 Tax=Pseudogemmobacter lacusdianii TaxID=3069608 RepID=A0ABU0W177_9RHOB|nr:phosphonate metabolism protein/1,5-bisphosphokinase (PRPP-forming) PhnN [Xinfangfangia sp. CPCC 101601]MDQ2067766.1 phosphonate metabolism protein/1,5-bisphosphokinase (PRPP-forming) PhnN [Xinfangfangia sp. CPCC 101601]
MIRLVAVVGPSGAGKDLLMAAAAQSAADVRLARRVITRPSAAGSEDFEGVSEDEFAAREARGEFALHWRAHGLGYAIPKAELAGEGVLLFNCSRQMLGAAQAQFPDLAVIHVTAPPEIIAQRLAARGRESGADLAARLARASLAMPEGLELHEVVNDTTPQEGIARFLAALQPLRGARCSK